MHTHSTARDAFREHLRLMLGDEWWRQEAEKHPLVQHPIARWQDHVDEVMRNAERDDLGRCLVQSDAIISAFMTLAYDLWVVRDNVRFQALGFLNLNRRRRNEHRQKPILARMFGVRTIAMARIVECRECHKPFKVTGGKTGPMIDREEIICPHCDAVYGSERIADVFQTFKLTPEEEAEYKKRKKD